MKTKYIIIVNQKTNADHSEMIKEDLHFGILNGHLTVESVEKTKDNKTCDCEEFQSCQKCAK